MNEQTRIRGEQVARTSDVNAKAVAPARETLIVDAPKRSRGKLAILASVPLLLLAVGLFFWLTSGKTVGTDNAYVKQDVTAISTQVNGPVAAV
jgi:membrane fusion protein (multidrug efflux system)